MCTKWCPTSLGTLKTPGNAILYISFCGPGGPDTSDGYDIVRYYEYKLRGHDVELNAINTKYW